MKKQLICIMLVMVSLMSFAGCKNKEIEVVQSSEDSSAVVSSQQPQVIVNPLTGEEDFDSSLIGKRPVAIMVNNVKTAQSVQTGLNNADIVYEAYAEGGITRLLAVFKDISKLEKIGTVRSARYSYVDLALGHDAIYTHAGLDPTKCFEHMKETGIDSFNFLKNGTGYSMRIKNGKVYEHTLYTTGELLNKGYDKIGIRRALKKSDTNWQAFVSKDNTVVPSDGSCLEITVPMSGAYVSKFVYDSSSKRYLRYSGSTPVKDYFTGKQFSFKNVLVLKTDVTYLDDIGYLTKTGLNGGEGYYISEGGFQKIKWTKGAAANPIKITKTDGSECPYNAGNTWVCMMDKTRTETIIGAPDSTSSAK